MDVERTEDGTLRIIFEDESEFYGQFDRLEDELGYTSEERDDWEQRVYEMVQSQAAANDVELSDTAAEWNANMAIGHVIEPAVRAADYAVSVLEDFGHDVDEAYRQAFARQYFNEFVQADWTRDQNRSQFRYDNISQLDDQTGIDIATPQAIFERYDEIKTELED